MARADRRELIERAATELFAARGYQGTSIDEIARRSGITAPVVYDHFASKLDLHRHLLERHYAELREVWATHLAGDDPLGVRLPRALDAWFAYVESHPYAWRMAFEETTGDPQVAAVHREIRERSRAALLPAFAREEGATTIAGSSDPEAIEMAWEVVRAVLQGLAIWWHDHQHIPRARLVEVAMNTIWVGWAQVQQGKAWSPP